MHPNEQVLRDLDEAQLRGDVEAFGGFFTDDVIVHVPGKSSLAGVYKGKDQFLELFGRFLERTPGVLVFSEDQAAVDEFPRSGGVRSRRPRLGAARVCNAAGATPFARADPRRAASASLREVSPSAAMGRATEPITPSA